MTTSLDESTVLELSLLEDPEEFWMTPLFEGGQVLPKALAALVDGQVGAAWRIAKDRVAVDQVMVEWDGKQKVVGIIGKPVRMIRDDILQIAIPVVRL